MRFTTLLYTSVFALATAQSTTTTAAPTTTDAATAAQNSQQAAIIACLNACKDGDVSCTSKCIAVPNPNNDNVKNTNKCVAECPKGNGTATDNLNYSNCVDGCIGKFYFTTSAGAGGAQATGGSGSPSGTGPAPSGSGSATGTSGDQASGTGSGSSPTSTPNFAAPGLAVAGSTAGFVGFLVALLAL